MCYPYHNGKCSMMIDEAANNMAITDIAMEVAVNIDDSTSHIDTDDLNHLV